MAVAESADHPLASAAALRSLRPTAAVPVVRLTYRVTGYAAAENRHRWIVDLGRDYVAVHNGDRLTVHDFALQRWLQIDTFTETFRNNSLHAEVAFRRAELNSRYDELAAAEARGLTQRYQISQMAVEASMSLVEPQRPPLTIERSTSNDVETFSHGGEAWTRARYAATRLSPEARASYARFLRRSLIGLHPAVVGHLLEQDRPVAWLSFRYVNPPQPDHWATLDLIEQSSPSLPYPLEARFRANLGRGAGPRAPTVDKVLAAAAQALANPAGARPLREMRAEIARLQAAGQPFAAWVLLMETVLQHGKDAQLQCREPDCPKLSGLIALEGSEPNIGLLQRADALRETDPKQAVALFRQVPRNGLANAYVIDFLQATALDLLQGRERAAALPAYAAAIAANPYLAHFYKGFADFLVGDGDRFTSWVILDIARALPRYPNDSLTEVDTFEALLRQHHPEQY